MKKDKIQAVNRKDLAAAGIPDIRGVVSEALKGANTAVRDGVEREVVLAAVSRLAMSPEPGREDLGSLSGHLGELAQALVRVRETAVYFKPRETPAPWKSWADGSVEPSAVEQIQNACDLPVAVGGALMPDAHQGYGLPIGGVLAVRNAVIPFAVGVDIACRMRLTIIDAPAEILSERGDALAQALESETRFGVGAAFGANELLAHPVMDLDWSVSPVTEMMKKRAYAQLGTSGSGNHFVEFGELEVEADIDEPGLRLSAGRYPALLSHSGARGTGEAVANHYSALAQSLHPELPEALRHLAWLSLDSEEGQAYWAAMELMGKYASANHELIHERVLAAAGLSALGFVENHHNFAWKEVWNNEELVIHRKGATPAGKGVLGIVPGSMGTRGFVVRGKGSAASYGSCSHGAGRRMSRKAAFRTLDRGRMLEILAAGGIRLLSGPLDESPEAYKDIEAVIAAQRDLIDVLAAFHPQIVKMAPAEETRPAWLKKRTEKREFCG